MKRKVGLLLAAVVVLGCVLVLLGYLCDLEGVMLRYHFGRIDPAAPLDRPSREHVQGVVSRAGANKFLFERLIDISEPEDVAIAVLLLPKIPGGQDQTPMIREWLQYALANTGVTRMGSPVHFMPSGEPRGVTWLRRNSIIALGDLRDEASIPLLATALASPDWDTRRCGERALLKMPPAAVYPRLLPLLGNTSQVYQCEKPHAFQRVCDVAVGVAEALSGERFGPQPAESVTPEKAAARLDQRLSNCRQWLKLQLPRSGDTDNRGPQLNE